MNKLKGNCLCNNIEFEIKNDNVILDAYCHCSICRKSHSSSEMHFVVFPTDNLKIIKGDEYVKFYTTSNYLKRYFCSNCGSKIYNYNSNFNTVSIFPALLEQYNGEATCHVNYSDRLEKFGDDLPKYKNYPKGFGSGELVEN
jgi:hypothetical protein